MSGGAKDETTPSSDDEDPTDSVNFNREEVIKRGHGGGRLADTEFDDYDLSDESLGDNNHYTNIKNESKEGESSSASAPIRRKLSFLDRNPFFDKQIRQQFRQAIGSIRKQKIEHTWLQEKFKNLINSAMTKRRTASASHRLMTNILTAAETEDLQVVFTSKVIEGDVVRFRSIQTATDKPSIDDTAVQIKPIISNNAVVSDASSRKIPVVTEDGHVVSRLFFIEETDIILAELGNDIQCLAMSMAQVWKLVDSQWYSQYIGVVCVVKDFSARSFIIKIAELESFDILFEYDITFSLRYDMLNGSFHTFLAGGTQFGLIFMDADEGNYVSQVIEDKIDLITEKMVKKKEEKEKEDVTPLVHRFIAKVKRKVLEFTRTKTEMQPFTPHVKFDDLMDEFVDSIVINKSRQCYADGYCENDDTRSDDNHSAEKKKIEVPKKRPPPPPDVLMKVDEPVTIEKQVTSDKPVKTKKPVRNEQPVDTDKLATSDKPIRVKRSARIDKPVENDKTVENDKLATGDKPIRMKRSARIDKPVENDKTVENDKLATGDKLIRMKRSVRGEKPVENNKPVENDESLKGERRVRVRVRSDKPAENDKPVENVKPVETEKRVRKRERTDKPNPLQPPESSDSPMNTFVPPPPPPPEPSSSVVASTDNDTYKTPKMYELLSSIKKGTTLRRTSITVGERVQQKSLGAHFGDSLRRAIKRHDSFNRRIMTRREKISEYTDEGDYEENWYDEIDDTWRRRELQQ